MSLRTKIVVYLAALHVVLGAVAWLVLSQKPGLLLAVELLFVVSIATGIVLVRALFVPLRMVRTGAELMRERDFTAHFLEVGQPELDELIRIYNKMIDRLREERLRAEEQHSFLEKVLDASPAGVVTLDYEQRVSLLNRSALRFLDAGPEPLRLVGRRVKIAHATFYDRGHPRSFYVLEEVTEDLRASEKAAYEKLIRMITHEVNNSVGAVRSLLESLGHYAGQVGETDRSEFRGALDVAVGRMNNLNGFMRGFSEVVRLPAPELRACAIATLVDDILVLLRPQLDQRRITASWDARDEIEPVLADKNQMEQVLVNVFKNAMEAIGEDGRIGVRYVRNGARPVLTIRDTGKGLTTDARAKLFTPFYSTKRDGRGLGLTVIREILAQHRFEYSLEPLPERGAEFRIGF